MADDSTQDGDEVVDATPERVLGVIDRMRTLPWPEDSDDTLEWVIDGLEGNTSFFAHLLVLGATSDATRLAALTMPVATLADERWGARQHFDATLFTDDADTDPAEYDRRSALASLVRALGSDKAIWWPRGPEAVVLIDNSDVAPEISKAAVLVLPAEWLRGSGAEEQALRDPLVADFLSGDGRRVLDALWTVVGTRDIQVLAPAVTALPVIAHATADVELGGMLASNSTNLDHALARLRLVQDGICLCAAYPALQFYDPEKEHARGHVRILDSVVRHAQGRPERTCECTDCDRRWHVEEGEYHYTWWKWTPQA